MIAKIAWAEEFLKVLWAIRTIARSATKETPFNLAFEHEAAMLVEIGINTLHTTHFDFENNEVALRANQDLLEEVKKEGSVKMVTRQQQVANYYNSRV